MTSLSIQQLIDQHAQTQGDKPYLIDPDSEQTLSYAQLQQQVRCVGQYLDDQEVASKAKVGLLMDNGFWTLVLYLGIMYSGRTVATLNGVAGADVIDYVLDHSDIELLFIDPSNHDTYATQIAQHPSLNVIISDEERGFAAQFNDAYASKEVKKAWPVSADDIAVLIYTSGTTGRPKGVLLSQHNLLHGGRNTMQAHDLTAEDVGLCVLPLYHINAQVVSVMAILVSGGSIVLPHKLSISQFWLWTEQYKCTWFSAVPTVIAYLIEHQQRNPDSELKNKLKTLRFGRSASMALAVETHHQFEALFALPIIETMGISECSAQILSNPMPPIKPTYGSPGLAVGNEVRVVDDKHQAMANGEIGELAVRGDNVMQGYYKNPEATKAALDADGWFYTGDLGYQDDAGCFFITGRSKELIIKGGENIAPREIDEVLYQHNAVLEAAAYGVTCKNYGQEIHAAVALKPNHSCSHDELMQLCREKLGDYKCPIEIHFHESLPKGPSGKIQRLKLADSA